LFVFPPVQILPCLQAVNAAIETDSIMAALYSSALHTPPLCILTLYKSGKRMLLDKGEILDETRSVLFLIPCVDSLQVPARESATFVTKPNSVIQKQITAFL
jgi:hypothetical protein